MSQDKIEKVKEYLIGNKCATVEDLQKLLSVSGVTVRKILNHLEKEGFLIRRYGGALLAENPAQMQNIMARIETAQKEKNAIARVCANLIEDGENIILDAGSTTLAIARHIRNRQVRIITNSLLVAENLCDEKAKASVEMLGGTLRKNSASVIGPQVCAALAKVRADKAMIGCSGFDPELGFFCQNSIEAETKHAMLKCASKKIIVCDHSKFQHSAYSNFASPDEIDMVISDRKPEANILKVLREHDVRLIVAK